MRKFKLRTGVSNPYEINVDSACDNPIQLIGLYKRLENTDRPYGKHYNRSLFLHHTMRQPIAFALIVLTRVK